MQVKNNLTEAEENFLQSRWQQACTALGIPSAAANEIYDQLHYEYADWNRYYHNLSHILNLLQLSEAYQAQIQSPELFDLAIWFHDYIYDAKLKDNEQQSAYWAEQLLGPLLKRNQLEYIKELILSTEGHAPRLPDNPDNLLFLDFDLSILSADKKTYKAYSEAIREEYKSLFSFFVYNAGRKKVLKNFLSRKSLYYTEHFKTEFEQIARANIDWEIKGLKEG